MSRALGRVTSIFGRVSVATPSSFITGGSNPGPKGPAVGARGVSGQAGSRGPLTGERTPVCMDFIGQHGINMYFV